MDWYDLSKPQEWVGCESCGTSAEDMAAPRKLKMAEVLLDGREQQLRAALEQNVELRKAVVAGAREDHALRRFAQWLVAMDDPASEQGRDDRLTVTLTKIIERAREALEA